MAPFLKGRPVGGPDGKVRKGFAGFSVCTGLLTRLGRLHWLPETSKPLSTAEAVGAVMSVNP